MLRRPASAETCLGHGDPVAKIAGRRYGTSEAPPEDLKLNRGGPGHCLAMGTCVNAYCIKYFKKAANRGSRRPNNTPLPSLPPTGTRRLLAA